jgi:hypothetical protein
MQTSDPVADSAVNLSALPQVPDGDASAPSRPPSGAPALNPNIALLVGAARDPTIDIAKLKELRAMIKEDEQDWRRSEFLTALAQAKAEFTPIVKTRLVDYEHKDGRGRTKYKYEDLADITDVIVPILSKHGITHSFRVDQSANPKIKVSCILAHANGYEDAPRMLEGVEDTSGQKSPNQAVASTITFLERGTLKQALGIAAGRDDDGQGAVEEDPVIAIDDVVYIETLLRDTDSNADKFLKWIGAPSIAEMRMSQFKRAAGELEKRKRKATADGPAQ